MQRWRKDEPAWGDEYADRFKEMKPNRHRVQRPPSKRESDRPKPFKDKRRKDEDQ